MNQFPYFIIYINIIEMFIENDKSISDPVKEDPEVFFTLLCLDLGLPLAGYIMKVNDQAFFRRIDRRACPFAKRIGVVFDSNALFCFHGFMPGLVKRIAY